MSAKERTCFVVEHPADDVPVFGSNIEEAINSVDGVEVIDIYDAPIPLTIEELLEADEKTLNADDLKRKYEHLMDQDPEQRHADRWAAHPVYTPDDWGWEASEGETRLGYWEWVEHQIAHNEEETP